MTYDLLENAPSIDHTSPPEPSLDDPANALADTILRTAGLHTS
jgi:hypothetical protein